MKQNKKVRDPAKYNPSLVGFVISLLLVAMLSVSFVGLITEMESAYPTVGDNSTNLRLAFDRYANQTNELNRQVEEIKVKTEGVNITQQAGEDRDLVANFLGAGYTSLVVTLRSFDIFNNLMSDSRQEMPFLNDNAQGRGILPILISIIIVLIFVGIVVSALLKIRT